MIREFRIVFIIALIFFIFGLTSFFQLGGFVTPFFFGRIILVIISLAFLIMNVKLKNSFYLFFCFIAMLAFALIDEFTVGYISNKTQTNFLIDFSYSLPFIYTSFFIYFGFYFTSVFLLQKEQSKKGIALGLCAIILISIFLFYLRQYEWQNLLFSSFLLIYVILVNKLRLEEKNTLHVLSAIFLLQFLLEVFKYLFRLEELI